MEGWKEVGNKQDEWEQVGNRSTYRRMWRLQEKRFQAACALSMQSFDISLLKVSLLCFAATNVAMLRFRLESKCDMCICWWKMMLFVKLQGSTLSVICLHNERFCSK